MGNSINKTIVEIDGVDCTEGFNALVMQGREKDKALESLTYLLEEHFVKASQTSLAGKFALSFSLVFDRLAGRTSIKAKIAYSRKFTDEMEVFAQAVEQVSLFDGEKD